MSGELSAVERDYSPSTCVPDYAACLEAYARRSADARAGLTWRELRYGPEPVCAVDFFPSGAGPASPLVGYLHGGYWQELDRRDSAFMAPGLVGAGVSVAVFGYGLAPAYRLDAIVAMVTDGARWLLDRAPELGVDPARVWLAGSSAGAHLAAMALCARVPVAGAILLSGVYDLAPLLDTYVNDALGLDAAAAARNSPLGPLGSLARLRGLPPLIVARGSNEPRGFVEQHDRVLKALQARATGLVVDGRNHFDLPLDLGDPDSELGSLALQAILEER